VTLLFEAAKEAIHVADDEGCTPLCKATTRGHSAVTKWLLKANAEVEHTDIRGCTPLMLASQAGEGQCALALLQAGASLHSIDRSGETALHHAAECGHAVLVDLLLSACGEAVREEAAKANPGGKAVKMLKKKMVAELETMVTAQDSRGRRPLHLATQGGVSVWKENNNCDRGATVTVLINAKADVNAVDIHSRSALMGAIGSKDLQCISVVRALIRGKADCTLVATHGCTTALHEAAKSGSRASREMLALMLQSSSVSDEAGKLLVLEDSGKRRPLHWACEAGDLEAIKLLVDAGDAVNAEDGDDRTPTELCKMAGEGEGVAYLQSNGGRTLKSVAMLQNNLVPVPADDAQVEAFKDPFGAFE